MTWLVLQSGRTLQCLETGAAIWKTRDGQWWHGFERDKVAITEPEKLLAALGHRWDGTAIVPIAAPVAGAPILVPADLSKPAEGGQYAVVLRSGARRADYPTEFGEKWDTEIVAAWRVVFL